MGYESMILSNDSAHASHVKPYHKWVYLLFVLNMYSDRIRYLRLLVVSSAYLCILPVPGGSDQEGVSVLGTRKKTSI